MARNKNRKYNWNTGSYNGISNDTLKKIALPTTIKCSMCKKAKDPRSFSMKEHTEVRHAIHSHGGNTTAYDVRCIMCSGAPILELHCQDCEGWKGLDGFAKSHRKDPENAVCKICMEERLAFEPAQIEKQKVLAKNNSDDSSSDYEYSDDDDDLDDDEDEEDDAVSRVTTTHGGSTESSINGSMQSLSINETTAGSVASSRITASTYFGSMNTTARGSAGGVALVGASDASSSNHQYGVPRSRAAGISSATASDNNRKFAKVPAYRAPVRDESSPQQDYESDEDVVEDDTDDDCSDEDDQYNGQWRDGNAIGN